MNRASPRRWPGIALYLLVLLCLQEALFRWLFPVPELAGFNRVLYMPVGLSAGPVRPVRSVRLENESAPDNARIVMRLNNYGFRGRDWGIRKDPTVPRIAFVGSSHVEGALADERHALPVVFQRAALELGNRVEAMNFGVSAADWGNYDGLITDIMPVFRPDAVVLVLSPIAFRVRPEEITHREAATFDRYPAHVPRLVTLAGMLRRHEMLPFRWPFRSATMNQPVPDQNNPWTGRERELLQAFEPFIANAVREGKFNPFRSGSNHLLAALLASPVEYREELRHLNEYVQANRAALMVAYIPDRSQVTDYYAGFERSFNLLFPEVFDLREPRYQVNVELLEESCRMLKIPFVDLTAVIRREEDAGHHVYWNYDDHLRPEGYELLGRELYRRFPSARQAE